MKLKHGSPAQLNQMKSPNTQKYGIEVLNY